MTHLKTLLILLSLFIMNHVRAQSEVRNTYLDALRLAKLYRQNEKLKDSPNVDNIKIYKAYTAILSNYNIDTNDVSQNSFLDTFIIMQKNKQIILKSNGFGLTRENESIHSDRYTVSHDIQ